VQEQAVLVLAEALVEATEHPVKQVALVLLSYVTLAHSEELAVL
jgi:hypothetical protein